MKVIREIPILRQELKRYRLDGRRIALVPTMGYFHEGHLSLMDIARQQANVVIVSLYVNPTQFGPTEDLEKYPRDFERDERLAKEHGVDIIFYPDDREMYHESHATYVVTEKLSKLLCGKSRPIHFQGVTTIVAKLFNVVQPDVAVFGRKDAQQAIIIQRMVEDLNFPVEIIVAPIIREPDGLAMSSRNSYLNTEERVQAVVIFQALQLARKSVVSGNDNAAEIRGLIKAKIETAALSKIEYIEIVNETDLSPVQRIVPDTFVAVAVWFGHTRLIDNLMLMEPD